MNLAQKVTYAIKLDTRIAQLQRELDEIKAELVTAALADDVPKSPTECGGWSTVFTGKDGQIARVTVPADKLKPSIDAESKEWPIIKQLLGPMALILFTKEPSIRYKVSKTIRDELESMGKIKRRKVLNLITGDSKTTVSFETKEQALACTQL